MNDALPSHSRPAGRLESIDVVRGAVMVLMAIDHVRVFSGLPGGGPTPGIFFTRWITHFCAPAFVFLAGTSAFLYGRTHRDLGRFLATRGLWLVLLELTFLRWAWTFNFDYPHYLLAGVLWVLGCSMVVLALLSRLPLGVVAAIGIAIVAGHNLLDPVVGKILRGLASDPLSDVWRIGYVGFFGGPVQLGAGWPPLTVLYSLVPWVGVMAAGFGFGAVVRLDAPARRRVCAALGLGMIALFVALRGFRLYGDPRPWTVGPTGGGDGPPMPAALAFLNTTKYPASFQFLLMTLGPVIALLPWLETARGRLARALVVFGRVPLFYYLLHIPLIHVLAMIVSLARTGSVDPWLFANHPMGNPPAPAGYVWSLGVLYAVWAAAVAILYGACRWYAGVKAANRSRWLRYL